MKQVIDKTIGWLAAMPQGIRRGLAISYIGLVTLLSLLPKKAFDDIPSPFDSFDKVVHALMYGGMALILCWVFQPEQRNSNKRRLVIFIFCSTFGMLMEILQGLFPQLNRDFSLLDEAANIAGTIAFILLWKAIGQKLERTP